jgi:SAM-dependent methyltransferase
VLTAADTFSSADRVECNMCGWSGKHFYPNTGPGYYERHSMCPGCRASDRYRSLYEVLRRHTSAFEADSRVVEVAPLRSLEQIFLSYPDVNYVSFDIERHAMERGDITHMQYSDDSVDWFICFHVLEHISQEEAALDEIHRVLRPGGSALFQVPIDWEASCTREYGAPDPRDVNHVRRHGRDFSQRIVDRGFAVEQIDIVDCLGSDVTSRAGLSLEPIFRAKAIKRA